MSDEAEREMDAQVAERIFGWQWWRSSVTGRRALFAPPAVPQWFDQPADGSEELCVDWNCEVPRYSADIAAVWLVVEKMRERHMMLSVSWSNNGGWWAVIYPHKGHAFEGPYCHSAPEAICRVTLLVTAHAAEPAGTGKIE